MTDPAAQTASRPPKRQALPEPLFVDQLEAMIPDLRRYARSLCRNDDLADDIIQESCLKAWAAREGFDPSFPLKPWLFRIVRNTWVQHCRRAWRIAPLDPETAETQLSVSADQEWLCDFHHMQTMMRHLPSHQQEALLLVLVTGFTYEEAALQLDCSEGTVKSRVSRGREALAGLLNRSDKDTGPLAVHSAPTLPSKRNEAA